LFVLQIQRGGPYKLDLCRAGAEQRQYRFTLQAESRLPLVVERTLQATQVQVIPHAYNLDNRPLVHRILYGGEYGELWRLDADEQAPMTSLTQAGPLNDSVDSGPLRNDRHKGTDRRPTDVHGRVIGEIIA
jgi:hypothetical protein